MKYDTPIVSIIVAAYNAESCIHNAINSCLKQTYTKFELIIINDGSTDGTKKTVEALLPTDPRIALFTTENGGQGRARNCGIVKSSGKYILILDADDELIDTALENLVISAEKHQSDLVFGEWVTYSKNRNYQYKSNIFHNHRQNTSTEEQKKILFTTTYYSIAKLYNKKLLLDNKIAYGEGYIYEDMEFLIGVYIFSKKISIIPNHVYIINKHEQSSTSTNINSTWHYNSFITATTNTINKYNKELSLYGKYYIAYIIKRLPFYSWSSKRVPFKYRGSFIKEVLSSMDKLNDDYNFFTLKSRYGIILKSNNISKYLSSIILLATHHITKKNK